MNEKEVRSCQVCAYHIRYVCRETHLEEEKVRAFAEAKDGFYEGYKTAITRECFAELLREVR